MGWIKQHLAEPGDEVHGLIIARDVDDELKYAPSAIPNVTVQTYRIEFSFVAPSSMPPR